MNSLCYLLFCGFKNFVRETLRKPFLLVMYIVVAATIAMSFVFGASGGHPPDPGKIPDVRWLGGAFFAFMLLQGGVTLAQAFGSGNSFFLMSDVNLLFVAPVAPQKILLYGVAKFFRTVLLSSLFILFQGGTFRAFGVGSGALLPVAGLFVLCSFSLGVFTMLLYGAVNGNPRRKVVAKALVALALLPLAVTAAVEAVRAGGFLGAVPAIVSSPSFQWVPVLGWGAAALVGFLGGNPPSGWFFLSLVLAAAAALLVLLFRSKADYYEDVLAATETAFEKRRALAEGNFNAAGAPARKVKVARTGLSGLGARALFGKHLRETLRKSRMGFVDTQTLVFVAGAAVFAFANRSSPEGKFFLALAALAWIQLFSIGTSPGLRELYTHYLYLVPAPSFSKIVWNFSIVVIKAGVDAILVFGLAGAVLREHPLTILGAVLAYALFSLLLAAWSVLSLRWTGADISVGVLFMVYLLVVMVVMAPAVVAAVGVGTSMGGLAGAWAALGIVCAWEALVAAVFFALSRGMLDNCDMPSMKLPK